MNRSRRSRMVPSLALAVALGAGACLPFPHKVTVTPAITGRLTDDAGAPVAGARVAVATGISAERCTAAVATTTTDADGRYQFARTRRMQWVVPLYGDWFHFYHICDGSDNRLLFTGMLADGDGDDVIECDRAGAAAPGEAGCRKRPTRPANDDRSRAAPTPARPR